MALRKEQKATIISEHGLNAKDTGSTEVQIALITKRINELTAHLKVHHKDQGARRGLLILVGQRRGLLDYLIRTNRESYLALIAKLGIRK